MTDGTHYTRAGWSEIEITPEPGIILGGRGAVITESTHVHDPLFAQALVLEDSRGERLLLVSLDLIGLGPLVGRALRTRVSTVAAIEIERVIVNSSHTHSGPFTHFESCAIEMYKPDNLVAYEQILIERVGRVAARAVENLGESEVHIHIGTSNIGINRRLKNAQGAMTMGPNPDGPYNRELLVLDVRRKGSAERCVAFSHACHPVLNVSVDRAMISADFPGAARRALKQNLGASVQFQFFQAACGNIRPRCLAEQGESIFRAPRAGDAERVGEELASDVLQTLELAPLEEPLRLNAVEGCVLVRKQPDPKYLQKEYWEELASQHSGASRESALYWAGYLNKEAPLLAPVRYWAAGAFSLTPRLQVAWMGGEPLTEWQDFLRALSGNPELILWGYTGEMNGYLPMDHHLPERGYEVTSGHYSKAGPESMLAPGIDSSVAQCFRKLFAYLNTDQS